MPISDSNQLSQCEKLPMSRFTLRAVLGALGAARPDAYVADCREMYDRLRRIEADRLCLLWRLCEDFPDWIPERRRMRLMFCHPLYPRQVCSNPGGYKFSCRIPMLCPWCWARDRVIPIFVNLDRLLFGEELGKTPRYDLQEVVTTAEFPKSDFTAADVWMCLARTGATYLKMFYGARPFAASLCQSVRDGWKPKGYEVPDYGHWSTSQHILAVVPRGSDPPPDRCPEIDDKWLNGPKRRIRCHRRTTYRRLVRVVRRCLSYPQLIRMAAFNPGGLELLQSWPQLDGAGDRRGLWTNTYGHLRKKVVCDRKARRLAEAAGQDDDEFD